jgi:hypothetical protein
MNIDEFNLDETPDDDEFFMKEKKKRVNGSSKGKRGERNICKELSKLFGDTFRRVPGSGMMLGGKNWYKNEGISESAKNTLTGDIITPEWFPYSIESKNYADSPKLHNIYDGEDSDLDKWISQASLDAKKCDKDWMLIFNITSKRKAFVCLNYEKFIHDFVTVKGLNTPLNYFIYKSTNIIIGKQYFFKNYMPKIKS